MSSRLFQIGAVVALVVLVQGCRSSGPHDRPAPSSAREQADAPGEVESAPASAPQRAAPPPSLPAIQWRWPQRARVVACGDVHGDLAATRAALKLAGALGDDDHWSGGALVFVQTGDQLDRGDDEREILELFKRLAAEAGRAGGAVHVLNGNHEYMNVAGDFRYVTRGGFAAFADVAIPEDLAPRVAELPESARPRAAAFAPGGPYALEFAARPTVLIVGDTVFVHGGVLPHHVPRLEQLHRDVQAWLTGRNEQAVAQVMEPDSVVWTRFYAESTDEVCGVLGQTLKALGAKRLVVGHTVQKGGITSACDGALWRIDVGMASHYGGRVQVLEIAGDVVRILDPQAPALGRAKAG